MWTGGRRCRGRREPSSRLRRNSAAEPATNHQAFTELPAREYRHSNLQGERTRGSGLGARGSELGARGSGLGARGSGLGGSGLGARGSGGLGARGSGLGARGSWGSGLGARGSGLGARGSGIKLGHRGCVYKQNGGSRCPRRSNLLRAEPRVPSLEPRTAKLLLRLVQHFLHVRLLLAAEALDLEAGSALLPSARPGGRARPCCVVLLLGLLLRFGARPELLFTRVLGDALLVEVGLLALGHRLRVELQAVVVSSSGTFLPPAKIS